MEPRAGAPEAAVSDDKHQIYAREKKEGEVDAANIIQSKRVRAVPARDADDGQPAPPAKKKKPKPPPRRPVPAAPVARRAVAKPSVRRPARVPRPDRGARDEVRPAQVAPAPQGPSVMSAIELDRGTSRVRGTVIAQAAGQVQIQPYAENAEAFVLAAAALADSKATFPAAELPAALQDVVAKDFDARTPNYIKNIGLSLYPGDALKVETSEGEEVALFLGDVKGSKMRVMWFFSKEQLPSYINCTAAGATNFKKLFLFAEPAWIPDESVTGPAWVLEEEENYAGMGDVYVLDSYFEDLSPALRAMPRGWSAALCDDASGKTLSTGSYVRGLLHERVALADALVDAMRKPKKRTVIYANMSRLWWRYVNVVLSGKFRRFKAKRVKSGPTPDMVEQARLVTSNFEELVIKGSDVPTTEFKLKARRVGARLALGGGVDASRPPLPTDRFHAFHTLQFIYNLDKSELKVRVTFEAVDVNGVPINVPINVPVGEPLDVGASPPVDGGVAAAPVDAPSPVVPMPVVPMPVVEQDDATNSTPSEPAGDDIPFSELPLNLFAMDGVAYIVVAATGSTAEYKRAYDKDPAAPILSLPTPVVADLVERYSR